MCNQRGTFEAAGCERFLSVQKTRKNSSVIFDPSVPPVRGDSGMYNMLMRSAVSVYVAVRICEPRVTGGGGGSTATFPKTTRPSRVLSNIICEK